MNDIVFNTEPKELVSDSIRDLLPSSEENGEKQQKRDTFISVMFTSNFTGAPVIGFLVGVELIPSFKLDVKLLTFEAFDFIAGFCSNQASSTINNVVFNYEEKIVKLDGPYVISSTKIVDVDSATSSCILAIDLVKMNVEKK
jgi:hypothetical protein